MEKTRQPQSPTISSVDSQPESTDPDYLAWKEAKVRAALKDAEDNPDEFLTQDEIWKKFNLDR